MDKKFPWVGRQGEHALDLLLRVHDEFILYCGGRRIEEHETGKIQIRQNLPCVLLLDNCSHFQTSRKIHQ